MIYTVNQCPQNSAWTNPADPMQNDRRTLMKKKSLEEIKNPELRFVCRYIEEEIHTRGFKDHIIEIDFEDVCDCDKIRKACALLGYQQKVGPSYMKRFISTKRHYLRPRRAAN